MNFVAGKVILVTGGANGIGFAIVKQLLENGAKAVAIVDISEEAGCKAGTTLSTIFGQSKVTFVKADVTRKQELENAFKTTVKIYNQLDIVINNAGVLKETDWEESIAVNLVAVIEGTYLAMCKFLPKYKSGEESVIVNIASVCAFQSLSAAPVYCATKYALIGFGQSVGSAEFHERYKVRVLTLCPGLVNTSMSTSSKPMLFSQNIDEELRKLGVVEQSVENVARSLLEILETGKNGSLWVSENDEPVYEVVVPNRKSMKV